MQIENVMKGNAVVFSLKGDLDFHSYRILKDALQEAVEKKLAPIVLNFEGVNHIDSMGLGTVSKMWKKAQDSGIHLRLAACNKNVEKLIHLVNLDKRMKLYATPDEAING